MYVWSTLLKVSSNFCTCFQTLVSNAHSRKLSDLPGFTIFFNIRKNQFLHLIINSFVVSILYNMSKSRNLLVAKRLSASYAIVSFICTVLKFVAMETPSLFLFSSLVIRTRRCTFLVFCCTQYEAPRSPNGENTWIIWYLFQSKL